jgi:dTDP-4-dehydrorhamnose 3,5-epimerase
MEFYSTEIPGCFIIHLLTHKDSRGFFTRTFCAREFREHGLEDIMVQSNWSETEQKNTIRGMHFQTNESEEAKLVNCMRGRVLDVCLDLRRESPAFGKYVMIELAENNDVMLYHPRGTAHGFLTLENQCQLVYLMSNYYDPDSSDGVRWNDPFFSIPWPISNPILSIRDRSFPDFL